MVGHGGMVRALAVSPNGQYVLTSSFDYSAKLWSFDEQKELADLNEHEGPVNAVAFMPDGDHALTASDKNDYPLEFKSCKTYSSFQRPYL